MNTTDTGTACAHMNLETFVGESNVRCVNCASIWNVNELKRQNICSGRCNCPDCHELARRAGNIPTPKFIATDNDYKPLCEKDIPTVDEVVPATVESTGSEIYATDPVRVALNRVIRRLNKMQKVAGYNPNSYFFNEIKDVKE